MTGLSDYSAKAMLNHITGSAAIFALPAVFLALFTAVGSDAGSGFTEVAGNGYARAQVSGTVATNATTASGNNILHFASTPNWVVAGMLVYNSTTPSVIPAATTVLSVTSTTVTLSANVTGGGVGNGNTILFTAFSPASGSAPSNIVNAANIQFPTPTGPGWGTVIAFGLYDTSSSGNLLDWDYLGAYAWFPASISQASPGTFTAHAHGLLVGYSAVYSTELGGIVPSFSQGNLTGLLAVAHATVDTFDVTNGGIAVNMSAAGSGSLRRVLAQAFAANTIVIINAGSLTLFG